MTKHLLLFLSTALLFLTGTALNASASPLPQTTSGSSTFFAASSELQDENITEAKMLLDNITTTEKVTVELYFRFQAVFDSAKTPTETQKEKLLEIRKYIEYIHVYTNELGNESARILSVLGSPLSKEKNEEIKSKISELSDRNYDLRKRIDYIRYELHELLKEIENPTGLSLQRQNKMATRQYNLSGRRVSTTRHGQIIIVNGHKQVSK